MLIRRRAPERFSIGSSFPKGEWTATFLTMSPFGWLICPGFVNGSGERKKIADELAQVEALIAKAKENLRPRRLFRHGASLVARSGESAGVAPERGK